MLKKDLVVGAFYDFRSTGNKTRDVRADLTYSGKLVEIRPRDLVFEVDYKTWYVPTGSTMSNVMVGAAKKKCVTRQARVHSIPSRVRRVSLVQPHLRVSKDVIKRLAGGIIVTVDDRTERERAPSADTGQRHYCTMPNCGWYHDVITNPRAGSEMFALMVELGEDAYEASIFDTLDEVQTAHMNTAHPGWTVEERQENSDLYNLRMFEDDPFFDEVKEELHLP